MWQLLTTKWADNIRIKRIMFTYEPRAGELGAGEVHAQIIDNRIDEDIDDNVLKEIKFSVKQQVRFSWEHDVQLHINDLRIPDNEPILLRTTVSGCNMKGGFSIGQIRIVVEISTYHHMLSRLSVKGPAAKLSPVPVKSTSKRFAIKEANKPVADLKTLDAAKKYRLV
ncbi:TPA_asm: P3 [Rose alphacytorhabdovirus 1]|nr:TPA_asm: P3 [Rose alphacytorhabdovirus 1]